MAIVPLNSLGLVTEPTGGGAGAASRSGAGLFSRLFDEFVGRATAQQNESDQALLSLATGQGGDFHDVTIAIAKADLSFRFALEVRNRLTEAYQEIQRMQI